MGLPQEALITLNQLFLPNKQLYISYAHNVFGEALIIHLTVKNGLRNKTNTTVRPFLSFSVCIFWSTDPNNGWKQSTGNEFRYIYVASCLSWMQGHDLVKIRKYAIVLILFQAAAHKAKEHSNPIAFSSSLFKQLHIYPNPSWFSTM
jgi:hypothetical protein